MESRAHAWAAGLFTLLLGAAALLAAMWFSGDTYERVNYTLESRHPVTGLTPQSIVRLRGVEVGRVEDIRFDGNDPGVILVRIGVRAGTPLTTGTVAQLRPQGITGLSYVMLDDTEPAAQRLQPGPGGARIPMRPAFTEELADAAKSVLVDAREMMGRVAALLSDENVAKAQRTLQNVERATERIAGVAAALEPAAKATPAMVEQARRTLAQVEPTIASVNELTRELSQRVEALDRMAKSAEQVGSAAEAMSDAIVTDALPRISLLADEIIRTAGSLDRLLMQLRDQPSSVVFGAPRQPPGPGEAGFAQGARR